MIYVPVYHGNGHLSLYYYVSMRQLTQLFARIPRFGRKRHSKDLRFVSHSNDYLPYTLTGPRLMDRKTSAVYCYWRLEGTIAWRVMGLSQTFQLLIFISRKKYFEKRIIMLWNVTSCIKCMRKDPLFLYLFRWFGVKTHSVCSEIVYPEATWVPGG